MSGGRASRDKGNRAERAIVKFLQERGFAAERVPLSGSAGGSYLGDLTVPVIGIDRVVEVKVRGEGLWPALRLVDRPGHPDCPRRSQRTTGNPAPQACCRDRGEGGCTMNAHVNPSKSATVSDNVSERGIHVSEAEPSKSVQSDPAFTRSQASRTVVLASLRCTGLRVKLIENEITAIGVALKGGLISPDVALEWAEEVAPGCIGFDPAWGVN